MIHPDDPFASRSYRTSREAFGVSIHREKPNRDWLWLFGAVVIVVALVFMAIKADLM